MKPSSLSGILLILLIVLFSASGLLHLIKPDAFLWLMPPWLPEHNFLILLSGAFEIICAVGLITKQRWSGYLSALVLLAIWPANIWYAFDVLGKGFSWLVVIAWIRLPLQIPLMLIAIKFSRIQSS
jgi:uncharacterized membrane protein